MSVVPREAAKSFDDVALDEFVLVAIMKHLESAMNSLLECDIQGAIYNLNFAWVIAPAPVRAKVEFKPGETISKKVRETVPSMKDILKHREWLMEVSSREIEERTYEEGAYMDREGVAASIYREKKIQEIVHETLLDLELNIVSGLEASGLYIARKGRSVIPTAELQGKEQAPLKRVEATYPR